MANKKKKSSAYQAGKDIGKKIENIWIGKKPTNKEDMIYDAEMGRNIGRETDKNPDMNIRGIVKQIGKHTSTPKQKAEFLRGRQDDSDKSRESKAGGNRKNVIVPGKETTVTIKGPDTVKSDLRGGALDEVVAPIAKTLSGMEKNVRSEISKGAKNVVRGAKNVKKSVYDYFDRPRNGKSKYSEGS